MSSWETEWFNKLGNEIMFQAMGEVDPIDPELVRRLGEDTKEKRDERMEKLVGNMRAKTTRSSYGDYPWNAVSLNPGIPTRSTVTGNPSYVRSECSRLFLLSILRSFLAPLFLGQITDLDILQFEPKLGDPDWQNHVRDWVESCTDKCSAWLIQEEESDSKLYIDLRAKQDIKSGDLILSEQVVFKVTTSDPEQVEDERLGGTLDHYYCNSCASLLVVPLQCPNEYQRNGTPVASEISPGIPTLSPLSLSFQDPSNTIQGSSSTGISTTVHLRQSLGNPAVPSMSAPQPSRRDFMFCSSDHLVPTCSAYCRGLSKDIDIGLCDTDIEQSLRRSYLNAPESRSVEDTKIQCLRDLLFLRAVTMAINVRGNPLQIAEIIFATCGPNMRGSILDESGEMVEPWSFVSHVVRPVHYLHRLFENTKTNQFLKLRQVDGWIVNTLLAKINRAMRVSDGPRYAKSFGADGMLADEFGPWDQRWDDLTTNHHSNNATNGKEKEKQKKNDDDNKEKSTWIASLNPLLNMIRIADPAKGEIPNVVIVQTDRVNVFAVQTEDGGVVIRAGEPLLRAKEGATEEMYDGDGYAEEMEESEEMGDMEGMYDEDGDGDADADANGDMDHDTTDHDADAQDSHSENPPSDPDFLDDMLYDASPPAADHRPFAYTHTDDEALLFDRDDDEDGDPDGLVFSARVGEVVTRREARWDREGW